MENRKYNTKSIVEAGLISAIIVVLMLITGYVPVISFVGTLALPIPVTLLYIRHNLNVTLTAVAVSTIITATLFNPISAVLSALSFAFIGITLGYCIRKNKGFSTIMLLLSIVSLIVSGLTVIISITLVQKTTIIEFFTRSIQDLNSAMQESIVMVTDIYRNIGISQEQLAQIEQLFKGFDANFFINILGAIIIFQAIFSAFINFVVAKAILKRFGYNIKEVTPFTSWYINNHVALLVMLPVAIGMFLTSKNIPVGTPILMSAQIVMQYVFLIIGVSVVAYFLKNRFNLPNGFIAFIAIFTAFNVLFATIYLYIGVADIIFDFRKVNPNRILKK